MTTLAEIMTSKVFTTDASASVNEVAEAMVKGRFGSALVMENGWLAGIFTERDVLRVAAAGTDPKAATVGEWMTRDPMTVPAEMDPADALQLMASHGFRHLPVVDGKTLLGVVSLRDVLSLRISRSPR